MLTKSVTINAETVEEAIEKGINQLNVSREQVEARIINEGKKGFLGFGKQEAIVEISIKNSKSLNEFTDKVEVEEKKVEFHNENNEKNAEEKEMIVENKTNHESEFEDDDEDFEEGDQFDELDKMSQKVAEYLINIIAEYGADASIEIERNGNQIIYNIDTEKSGLIIGKHGKIINSLQILAQSLLHHYYKHRASIVLNVGDYRDRRANVLEQIAQRTAEEVLKTKQPAILDSLPSYERKQIHAHLSNIDHIKTHSEGKDPNRYLVVEYVNE